MATSEANRTKDEAPLIDLGPETEPVVRSDIDDKGGEGDDILKCSPVIADSNQSGEEEITATTQANDATKTNGQNQNLSTISDTITTTTPARETATTETTMSDNINCEGCKTLGSELKDSRAEVIKLREQVRDLGNKLEINKNELEREVQRRCELEQKFTEEAKRSTDQISELISKSNQDDARLSELRRKFEDYSNETSIMIESFTTNREVLSSQLLELRQENDYLLGKFLSKSRDLQNESINLPQTVDELQFHCLTLNEKLILATLAKEQLEDVIARNSSSHLQQPMSP